MHRWSLISLCITAQVITTLVAFVYSVSAVEVDFGRFYALLIGNEGYKHWNPLQTPHDDVNALAQLLVDRYRFDQSDVRVIKDVNRDQIINELETLKAHLKDHDNLLIYYAGHGKLSGNDTYWIGVDATKNSVSRWLHYRTVASLLDDIRARHVLVIADSCYAGAIFRGTASVADRGVNEDRNMWLDRMSRTRARTVLTAGGTEPVVGQVGNSKHSIFADELLTTLRKNKMLWKVKLFT